MLVLIVVDFLICCAHFVNRAVARTLRLGRVVPSKIPMRSEKKLSTHFEAILITSPRGCSEPENRRSEALVACMRYLEKPDRSARHIDLDARGQVRQH